MMLGSPLATLFVPHVVWALMNTNNQTAIGVVVGLALIALAWIAAGLWMVAAGGRARRIHR